MTIIIILNDRKSIHINLFRLKNLSFYTLKLKYPCMLKVYIWTLQLQTKKRLCDMGDFWRFSCMSELFTLNLVSHYFFIITQLAISLSRRGQRFDKLGLATYDAFPNLLMAETLSSGPLMASMLVGIVGKNDAGLQSYVQTMKKK